MSNCVPPEAETWIVRHEGCPPEKAKAACRDIDEQIRGVTRPHLDAICDQSPPSDQFEIYIGRVWRALEYHWKRLGESQALPFRRLLDRAEAADLGVGTGKSSLVYDLVLAQALEFKGSKAAEMFEIQFMPEIRDNARRAFGKRGLEWVADFAYGSHLLLPEGSPKIAAYRGRTFLRLWLRSVVYNHCVSVVRKDAVPLPPPPEPPPVPPGLDHVECQILLRPIFESVLNSISAEDCVLLKMLFLDGVPQNCLARLLGIHSGNVTRRHQNAAKTIVSQLKEQACRTDKERLFDSCIELVLTGEDPALRDWLGQLLGTALNYRSHGQQHGGPLR